MDMEKLVALCRRRGFIFQSSEIYGGIGGFWDYGPLGVELKKNIKDAWWHDMVRNPPPGPEGQEISMVGVDCAIIMNPKVWEASGHVGGFADPMVDCKKCRRRFRADKVFFVYIPNFDSYTPLPTAPVTGKVVRAYEANDVAEAKALFESERPKLLKKRIIPDKGEPLFYSSLQAQQTWNRPCPVEGCDGELTEPRSFNLMFKTTVGALEDASSIAYLRPETAQGIFANFKNVLDSTRLKLPFGIAQVGKAFRNEINPRNFTFRSREFEQMELAHYSIGTTDIEYLFPFAEEPQELEGVAHRGDYDLTQHAKHSGKDLSYFDEDLWAKADKSAFGGDKKKEQEAKLNPPYRFMPHVIEPSAGADRFTLAVLCEAYAEDEIGGEARTVMRFHPRLAPIKAAVLPLVNKEGMPEKAEALYRELKREFNVFFDDKGAVGRRYRRQDEAGTPFCFTIDGQTLQDDTVTMRERDSTQQTRIPMREVTGELRRRVQP